MRFIIDGYNLLHVMGPMTPRMGPTGLQKARVALLGVVAGAMRDRSGDVTVVFDGAAAPSKAPAEFEHRGVHVRFAIKGEQADDLIEALVRSGSTPAQMTVVSNDRRLVKAAHRRGCASQSCEDFLAFLNRQYRQRPGTAEPAEKTRGLGEGQTERWLKQFADLADDPAWERLFPYSEMEKE